MQIRSIQPKNNENKNNISHKAITPETIVRTLRDSEKFTTTMILEGGVTGGRGYNAYKRGGIPEFRERFADDIISAIFWMKGVDIFNGIFNKAGKKFLGIEKPEFDVGNDALRTPFENLLEKEKLAKGLDDKATEALRKKLSTFKFGKVIASTLLAIAFVGFVVTKFYQAVTKKLMKKEKAQNPQDSQTPQQQNTQQTQETNVNTINNKIKNQNSFEEFNKKISNKNETSFKGAGNFITTAAYLLEKHKVVKLLSTDVGIVSGRMASARNKDEAIEYGFRDVASSFFYQASTPLLYGLFQLATKSKKATTIDTQAAKQMTENLTELVKNGGKIKADEFFEKAIGHLTKEQKELLENLPFKDNVISLKAFIEQLKDADLIEKATQMAKLQPEQAKVGTVLTRQQAADVLKNGTLNTPEFMMSAYKDRFGEALTDPTKFIPMKQITKFRENMDDYVKHIIEVANKKNGGIIDENLLKAVRKSSFIKSASFISVAVAISTLCIGMLVPKLQYAITKYRTGSDKAPGLREYENKQPEQAKKA